MGNSGDRPLQLHSNSIQELKISTPTPLQLHSGSSQLHSNSTWQFQNPTPTPLQIQLVFKISLQLHSNSG